MNAVTSFLRRDFIRPPIISVERLSLSKGTPNNANVDSVAVSSIDANKEEAWPCSSSTSSCQHLCGSCPAESFRQPDRLLCGFLRDRACAARMILLLRQRSRGPHRKMLCNCHLFGGVIAHIFPSGFQKP